MTTKIMTPVTKSNIGCTDGEVDLELQRIPTLYTSDDLWKIITLHKSEVAYGVYSLV